MGLDMYLYASRKGDEKKAVLTYDNDSSTSYVLHYPDGRKEDVNVKYVRFTHASGKQGWYWSYYVNGKRVARKEIANPVDGEFAYWRKFNALHRWFVENYEGGHEDDCEPHELSFATLDRLMGIMKELDAFRPKRSLPDWNDADSINEFNEKCRSLPLHKLSAEARDFLNGVDIDADFFYDVNWTLRSLKKLDKKIRDGKVGKVLYQASW